MKIIRMLALALLVFVIGGFSAPAQDKTPAQQAALAQLKTFFEQDTFEQLQVTYNDLNKQYFAATDDKQRDWLNAELNVASDVLTEKNLAVLRGNDAAFEGLAVQINEATVELNRLAHKKWCHQTPWRLIRGYREPAWCSQ
jgi:hypothetical protein